MVRTSCGPDLAPFSFEKSEERSACPHALAADVKSVTLHRGMALRLSWRRGTANTLFKPSPRAARGLGLPAPSGVERCHHVSLDPASECVVSNPSELFQEPLLFRRG
jgi:hypothetical protein